MAPDFSFDDTPVFQRQAGTPLERTEDEDTGDAVDIGLATLTDCAKMLFKARSDQKIAFEPGVTAAMLETMGVLLMRAARSDKEKRFAMVNNWLAIGPDRIEELIRRVEGRQRKLLAPGELTMLLSVCPPDGD